MPDNHLMIFLCFSLGKLDLGPWEVYAKSHRKLKVFDLIPALCEFTQNRMKAKKCPMCLVPQANVHNRIKQ